jgi:hypothetical protein
VQSRAGYRPMRAGVVYGKDKSLALEQVKSGLGGVWTWKASDADMKLVISYTIGDRGAETAKAFMRT